MRLIKYHELEVGKFYLWHRTYKYESHWVYHKRTCFLFRCIKYRQSYDERLWYELLGLTTSVEIPRMIFKEEGALGSAERDISLSKFRDDDREEDLYIFELNENEILNHLVAEQI